MDEYNWRSRDNNGNAVSLPSQLLVYPPTLSASNAAVIQHTYGFGGALLSTTDPDAGQHVTTYTLSQCPLPGNPGTYTLPGTTTYANGSHITQIFDCSTGLVSGSTDVHRVPVSNTYDPIGRLLTAQEGIAQPRDTTHVYNETTCLSPSSCGVTAQTPAVLETYRDLNMLNDQSVASVQTLDQRGQLYLTQNNDIYTQNLPHFGSAPYNYEAVSNPYRSTGESTMGWTRTVYDQVDRPVEVDHFDGGTTPGPWGTASPASYSTRAYNGNTTTIQDEALNTRVQTVDGFGRLTCVTEDPGPSPHFNYTTVYTYDVGDNLTSVNQVGNNPCGTVGGTRTFIYDSLNRLYQATNPESGTTTYTYDAAGNLLAKTSGKGTVSMTYDNMNRVQTKSYTDGTPAVTYCYDGSIAATGCSQAPSGGTNLMDELTMVTSSGVSTSLYSNYDEIGDVANSSQATNGQTYPFTYTYNLLGEITQIIYPMSGRIVNTSYDSAGRAVCVTMQAPATVCASAPSQTYVNNVVYAPNHAVSTLPMGNGLTEATTFNTRFQPTQINAGSLLALNYTYGTGTNGTARDNGNVLGATTARSGISTPWSLTPIYDGVNRLTGATESGPGSSWSESYGYDTFGNRWMISSNLSQTYETPTSNSYNAANQISSWNYDAAGNLTGISAAGDSTTRATCAAGVAPGVPMLRTACYDLENRMTSETALDGTTSTYAYDGDGRRVQKTTGYGQTIVYVYDASGQLASELSSVAQPTQTQYLTADALGSTRLVTNSSGGQVMCYDYLPFGGDLGNGVDGRGTCFESFAYPESSPDVLNEKFTGKERDAETGLDYFQTRYFSSAQGRFTSPDKPLIGQDARDPQSWNLYTYVRNNPLRYTDPDGLDYHVCTDNGNGGQNCFNLNDDQYVNLYKQQNGQQGINLPGGLSGSITCGGQVCGSASYFEPSMDNSEMVSIGIGATVGGAVAGKVLDWAGSLLGRFFGQVAGKTAASAATDFLAGKVVTGFSAAQRAMLQKSLTALEAAGYNTGRLQSLIRIGDAPAGYFGMSLSDGAALTDQAFSSQAMLNHTLEHELIHMDQTAAGLRTAYGPGTAQGLEAGADAQAKFPEPQQ